MQLNAFEPVIAYRLLRGIDMLRNACLVLRERCITGITANADRMRHFVEHSIGIVTALVPVIGYEVASDVARTALQAGASGLGMNNSMTMNNGLYRVFRMERGGCIQWKFFARPRMMFDAPFVHYRVDNLNYTNYAPTRDPIPGFSLYSNGGRSFTT
jgi:hypothetical protein